MAETRRKESPAATDDAETTGAETARLRAEVDAGLTGDKIAAADPAAAPLGTDAETAGQPTPVSPDSRADPTSPVHPPAGHRAGENLNARTGLLLALGASLVVILLFLAGIGMVYMNS